jgi:(p)ppGpp synthase/HD superfamily hydrolase
LVAQATNGEDADLAIAALLHDAVEDQEVPIRLIEKRWGKGVAST